MAPTPVEAAPAADFLADLLDGDQRDGRYVPRTGGLSGLGANLLADGRVLFGLYHPTAARVHVMGSFNGWQHPDHDQSDPDLLIPMRRFRGWFDTPTPGWP